MSANNQEKRVVIVEDDPEMIELVKLILAKDGFKVAGAGNGRHSARQLFECDGWTMQVSNLQPVRVKDRCRDVTERLGTCLS